MKQLSISSATLSLISFFFFAFVSCKNSPSGKGQTKDSATTKDSVISTPDKQPGKASEPPVLKIGKSVDYENKDVLGSSIFSRDDTMFVYYLLNHKKFAAENLNLRFYRVQENGVELLESVIISVDPQENAISDSFELHKVYNEFGKGQFEMQFLRRDSIIAARSFLLL